MKRNNLTWMICLATIFTCGCTQEMVDQPRYEPLEASRFFTDGQSARPPIEGTVARHQRWMGDPFFTGRENNELVTTIPPDPHPNSTFKVSRELLERGRRRYDIFCAVCHSRTGDGDGMAVRRGFPQPASFHEARLRDETPLGHYFDVITHGYRNMPAYGARISAQDRWAITAYVRALQRSRTVVLEDAPLDIREQFDE